MQTELRLAQPAEAAAACELYLLSRRTFLPYAPVTHSPAEVQGWFEGVLLPHGGLWLAWAGQQLVGILALEQQDDTNWIDQLYLHPGFTGRGLGSQLVDFAKQRLGPPIQSCIPSSRISPPGVSMSGMALPRLLLGMVQGMRKTARMCFTGGNSHLSNKT